MKNFKSILPFLLVLLLAAPLVHAQTTTTTTTLSVALTDTSGSRVVLASGTNVAANGFIFVDKELMSVVGAVNSSTTVWTVRRGAGGIVGTHAAAAKVVVAAPAQAAYVFRSNAPSGTCTATSEAYLPFIVVPTGEEINCTAGRWVSDANKRTVTYMQGPTVANAVTSQVFIADRAYVVTGIKAVWGVKETTGAMDVTPEKATGTTACGSGTALLSAAIDATGTANTVATGTLSATAASLHLAAGDRLCVKLSATPNEIANLAVTFTLVPK